MSDQYVTNPLTKRPIKVNGPTYNKLIQQGIDLSSQVPLVKKIPIKKKSTTKIPIKTKPVEKIPIKKKSQPKVKTPSPPKIKTPSPPKIKTPSPPKIKTPSPPKTKIKTPSPPKILQKNKGKVRIGQKRRRGVKGDKDASMIGYKGIDVTSGSFNKVGGYSATTLSPMKLGPYTDKNGLTSKIFENYWQFSKLWATANHIKGGTQCQPTEKWFEFRKKGFQLDKGKRHPLPVKEYGYPQCSIYNDKVYDYLTSRKEIYVPIYKSLIENLPIIKELRKLIDSGQNIMIIDGDGPPKDIYPQGLELTQQNWDQMINNPKYQFGHGYVVAGLIAGLI